MYIQDDFNEYEESVPVKFQAGCEGFRDKVEVLRGEWRRLKTSQKALIVITFTAITVVLMSRISPEVGQIINTVKGSFLNLIRTIGTKLNSVPKALEPGANATNTTIDVVADLTTETAKQLFEKCQGTSEGYVANDSFKCVINGLSQMIDNLQGRFKELSDKIGELNTKVSGAEANFLNRTKYILNKFGELNTTVTNNIDKFNQRLDGTNIEVNQLIEYCVRNFNNIIGAINSLSNEATGQNLITTTPAENTTISLADSSENSVWSLADFKLDEEAFKELLKFLNSFSRDIKSTGETANNGVVIGAVSGAVSALAVVGTVFAVIKTKGGENKKLLKLLLKAFMKRRSVNREVEITPEEVESMSEKELVEKIVEFTLGTTEQSHSAVQQSETPSSAVQQSVTPPSEVPQFAEENHESNQGGSERVGQLMSTVTPLNGADNDASGQPNDDSLEVLQPGTSPSAAPQLVEENRESNQERFEEVERTISAGISSNNAVSNANEQTSLIQEDVQQSVVQQPTAQQPTREGFEIILDDLSDQNSDNSEGAQQLGPASILLDNTLNGAGSDNNNPETILDQINALQHMEEQLELQGSVTPQSTEGSMTRVSNNKYCMVM